jgi:transposase
VRVKKGLIRLRKDLEGHVRGVLKTFGIGMIGIGQGLQRQAFRDQLAAAGDIDPALRPIADAFIAAHAKLRQVPDDLDKAVKKTAMAHTVARRLMTIPGAGSVNALSFMILVGSAARRMWALFLG